MVKLSASLTRVFLASVACVFASIPLRAQLLPPDWQKAVVLIESEIKINDQTNYQPLGTGFLVGKPIEGGQQTIFLVTAKHVLAAALTGDKVLYLRIDAKSGGFQRVQIHLGSKVNPSQTFMMGNPAAPAEAKWAIHLNYDIAVVDVFLARVPDNLDYRIFDVSLLADQKELDSLSIGPTDSVFIIVYDSSFGIRLVRSGMVSAVLGNTALLLEARNVHGDSGSPVVLQPVLSRKQGQIAPVKPSIVGLISQVYSRIEPIGKFGDSQTDLMFPQPMNLSVVQPSPRILEVISALSKN